LASYLSSTLLAALEARLSEAWQSVATSQAERATVTLTFAVATDEHRDMVASWVLKGAGQTKGQWEQEWYRQPQLKFEEGEAGSPSPAAAVGLAGE
jgi:hypothetical protein